MTLNGSGIRDIQRVLGLSICGILFILRCWFKTLDEPIIEGHFKSVQIDWASPTKCGLSSSIVKQVKDGFGTPTMQILVKYWLSTSENATIQLVKH